MITLLFLAITIAVSVIGSLLLIYIRFLPYISYAIINLACIITIHEYVFEISHIFLVWMILTIISFIFHYFANKSSRLKLPLAIYLSSGIDVFPIIILCIKFPLQTNPILYIAISLIIILSSTIIILLYSEPEYVYDIRKVPLIMSYPIYSLAFGFKFFLFGTIIDAIVKRGYDFFNFLLGAIGLIVGIIIGIIINNIYTNRSTIKIKEIEKQKSELKLTFRNIGIRLNECATIQNLSPVHASIIVKNFEIYEELKKEIDFDTGSVYAPVAEKLENLIDSTNQILNQYIYNKTTKKDEPGNRVNDQLRAALSLFMYESISEVTLESLKSRRNKLIKSFHPDNSNEDAIYTQKINAAYELIKKSI